MGKKLSEASKWRNQRWFRLLPPISKLVLCYLEGVCDIDGTWEIDCTDLMDDLGLDSPFSLDDFITSVNTQCDKLSGQQIVYQRVVKIGTNYLWLVDYVKLQCESMETYTLNPAGKFVQKAFYKLGAKGVLAEGILRGWIPLSTPIDTLSIPYRYPIDTPRDIDIDIERDKDLLGRLYPKEAKESKRPPEKKGNAETPVLRVVGVDGSAPANPEDLPLADEIPEMVIADFQKFEEQLLADDTFVYQLYQNTGWKELAMVRNWLRFFNLHITTRPDLRKDYTDYKSHFKHWLVKQDFTKPPPTVISKRGGSTAGVPMVSPEDLKKYSRS